MDSDERDYDQLIGKSLTVHLYSCEWNYKNINSNGTWLVSLDYSANKIRIDNLIDVEWDSNYTEDDI